MFIITYCNSIKSIIMCCYCLITLSYDGIPCPPFFFYFSRVGYTVLCEGCMNDTRDFFLWIFWLVLNVRETASLWMWELSRNTALCRKAWKENNIGSQQGCAGLRFFVLTRLWLMWQSGWFDSDSIQHFTFLAWLCTDPTQIPNLVTWINSDSTNLNQSWVKSDLQLITLCLIWPKVVDRGCGGAVDCYYRLVLSLYRYRQINAKS